MSAAGARDAARAYLSTCGSEMDPTGGRCWDCSRLLAAALSGTRLSWTDIGLNRPPEVVMELGAGTGDLAIELSDSGSRFSHGLALYLATDVQGRAEQIRQRVAGLGAAERERLRVAPLRWGQPMQWGGSGDLLPRAPDLVLACELLYYSAENCMEDRLIPLADTLASACRERGTVALVAFRERSAELEAAFFGACRDRGLAAEPCAPELLLECGGPAGAARRDPHGGAVRLIKLVKTF